MSLKFPNELSSAQAYESAKFLLGIAHIILGGAFGVLFADRAIVLKIVVVSIALCIVYYSYIQAMRYLEVKTLKNDN